MKKCIAIALLSLTSLSAFAQESPLLQAVETAVLKKGVRIMVWENEYSPKDDIRPWGTQKAECAVACGADTPEGKLITQASTADYIAVANQIRGDLMYARYNFAGKLRAMGKDLAKWSLMKAAYQNAAFGVIREMYQKQYGDGVMNAAGNSLICTEMIKAGSVLDGKPLQPLATGTVCSDSTYAVLIQRMHSLLSPPINPEAGRPPIIQTYTATLENSSAWVARFRFTYDGGAPTDWFEVGIGKSVTQTAPQYTGLTGVEFQWKRLFDWVNNLPYHMYAPGDREASFTISGVPPFEPELK